MTLSFITSEKSTFKSFAKEALKRKKKVGIDSAIFNPIKRQLQLTSNGEWNLFRDDGADAVTRVALVASGVRPCDGLDLIEVLGGVV